jgi:carbon storage regulator
MLVLSRRPDEKILLPTIPAVIKVISAQGGLVRLGIEAPDHVPILREELCPAGSVPAAAAVEPASGAGANLRQVVRNRLNNLALGLALLRMQLAEHPEVRTTLVGLDAALQALRGCADIRAVEAGRAADREGPTCVPAPA